MVNGHVKMMYRKRKTPQIFIAGIIISLFSGYLSFAQPTNTHGIGKSDPKAQAILDKVSKKYKSFKSVKGAFLLKIENSDLEINEEQNGQFFLKGDKFKLDNDDQEIICDNETIWVYLKEANEVQINLFEPDENTFIPAQLFTIYEKNFLSLLTNEINENGKRLYVIDLTPVDKTKPYFKIKLFINKVSLNIKKAKVFDKNGNRYTYIVKDFKGNPGLQDTFFRFDQAAHKGVEIIDLR